MKKVYKTENLSCANCAVKFEEKLKSDKKFHKISVNITNNKIIVDQKDDKCEAEYLQKMIDGIESGIKITCDDDNHNDNVNKKDYKKIKFILKLSSYFISLVSLLIAILLNNEIIKTDITYLYKIFYIISYVFLSHSIMINMVKAFINKDFFNENTLMIIASVGALIIPDGTGHGLELEAIAVIAFYMVGEYFQDKAVDKSKRNISEILDLRPDTANLIDGKEIRVIDPKDLKIGDVILVKPGEKIAVDGVVVKGNSSVDTKALTGESLPLDIVLNSEVSSGFINISNPVEVRVSKLFKDSTASKILEFVENNNKKAPTEKFITKFAKYYTPAVVVIALLFAFLVPVITMNVNAATYMDELVIYGTRSIVFLVISCPCALVLSVPLTFFSGIGLSSKKGILFKSSSDLDNIRLMDVFIFDKTGTLTKGSFEVTKFVNLSNYPDEYIKECVKAAEINSNHPIAKSIVKYSKAKIINSEITEASESFGKGVTVNYKGASISVGNEKYLDELKIKHKKISETGTIIYISVDNVLCAYLVINDLIKESSKETIDYLKSMGKEVVMVTGDSEASAKAVALSLGIDKYYFSKMPLEKGKIVEEYQKTGKKVLFVGDGINDAPVLSIADIGVSMGSIGSDVAIEASDVVLMRDTPNSLIQSDKISKLTKKIALQNIVFAISVKVVTMVLGAIGIPAMVWIAVFADVGVSLLAVLNSIRILYTKKINEVSYDNSLSDKSSETVDS